MSADLQSSQEWRELVYDYYEQLLTLSTAGIAVLLVILDNNLLEKDSVRASLGNFALSAFFALLGMMRHVGWFPYQREQRRPYMPFMAYLSTFTLIIAVGLIVGDAINPPPWIMHSTLAVLVVALLVVLFGDRIGGALRRFRR